MMKPISIRVLAALSLVLLWGAKAHADPSFWKYEWPKTDFTKTAVDYREILSGGPPKDGIPAIDEPKFVSISEIKDIKPTEPVIGVEIEGEARAYPLRVLMWHEIVNDEIAGVPISVTFCPLCNASIVFDRRVEIPGKSIQVLDFGTTGKLRRSDLVMYDRQTESWWQQFVGEAIVGDLTGLSLKMLPVRIESYAKFVERNPEGLILIPNGKHQRAYGKNPYEGYDSLDRPFLYRGEYPTNIAPLARIVSSEGRAWALDHLRSKKKIETSDGLILEWEKGQNSALDSAVIGEGVDIGNVSVYRMEEGKRVDIQYSVDFAFAFYAFRPDIEIVTK